MFDWIIWSKSTTNNFFNKSLSVSLILLLESSIYLHVKDSVDLLFFVVKTKPKAISY